jgi:probable HAF family extracellular repeat protein
MNMNFKASCLLAVLVGITVIAPEATRGDSGSGGGGGGTTPASFQGLGQLPGWTSSYALGVSGNGSVVVGYVARIGTDTRAFVWTAAGGMQDLGTLGGNNSEAYAASSDGLVVVGRATNSNNYYRPFRWTTSGGMADLGTFPPQWLSGDATGVSADGNSVVGVLGQAQRWRAGVGLETLGNFRALGISADGQSVVGLTSHAVRWTATSGLQDLGTVGGSESFAEAASANGSVVVGQSRDRNAFWKAFSWTAAGGMRDLGTLGGPMSAAHGVSHDGAVIIGTALTTPMSSSNHAFRWTTRRQMQDLQRELLNASVTSVQNWILFSATSVSSDGTVIVGFGLNPSRQWEAFRATLGLPR